MNKLLISCDEMEKEIKTKLKGNIPEWLNVEMIRLGPAKWDLGNDFSLNHYLDGYAMLCKFSIGNDYVNFQTKFLYSDAFCKMLKAKRPVYTEFGTRSFPDPCKNVFSRFFSQLIPSDLTDNGCVNVYKLSNEYYASSETCNIWKFCQNTLNIQKKINLDKIIGVNHACSHVQYMADEDYAYNMCSSILTGMKYHLVRIPMYHFNEDNNNNNSITNDQSLLERSSILATISASWTTSMAYYHSFGITKNFIIFIELPLVVNGFKLATCTPKGRPLKDCFEWKQNEKTRFYVICKETGNIVNKYYAEPFFFFHIINSYEIDEHIVIDFMAYQNASILDKWDLNRMRQNIYDTDNQSAPTRFILPLQSSSTANVGENLVKLKNTLATATKMDKNMILLKSEQLSKPGFELPTINKQFNGKRYQFCYGSGVFEKGNYGNTICKFDVENRTVLTWKHTDEFFPGECIFVARPGSTVEDDGVLLCVVLSTNESYSHFLLILDGKTFTEIGRADIASGFGIIPPTIHGVYDYVSTN